MCKATGDSINILRNCTKSRRNRAAQHEAQHFGWFCYGVRLDRHSKQSKDGRQHIQCIASAVQPVLLGVTGRLEDVGEPKGDEEENRQGDCTEDCEGCEDHDNCLDLRCLGAFLRPPSEHGCYISIRAQHSNIGWKHLRSNKNHFKKL